VLDSDALGWLRPVIEWAVLGQAVEREAVDRLSDGVGDWVDPVSFIKALCFFTVIGAR
jgi:hypothetical protein